MANAFISSFTELTFLNTTARSGVVIMPSTNIPGRILTFKDRAGTLSNSTITFSTASATQLFEDNVIRDTNSDAFGSYSFATGTDNKWYYIGGSYMNSAVISSITTIATHVASVSTANTTISTLQIYDSRLTSTQTISLVSTNLYYSTPINFFVVGPAKAPKPLFLPLQGLFQPNTISGLNLWLDGGDANTIQLSQTNVIAWRDKSGNNRNATITGTLPYSNSVLNSLGSPFLSPSGYATTAPFVTATNGDPSIFLVVNQTLATGAGGNSDFLLASDSYLYLDLFGSGNTFIIRLDAYGSAETNTGLFMGNTPVMLSVIGTPAPTYAASLYGNGSINATVTATGSATYPLSGSRSFIIGGGGTRFNGYVYELIMYNNALTTSQRQQVEGYLAWKWGLVRNIPAAHPYKRSPPTDAVLVIPISQYDFNNYTASSSTLANSISGAGAATIRAPTLNTFNTSTPGNFFLTIYAPNNFPGTTGGIFAASITSIRTIELWVNYTAAVGYSQYFLDFRSGLANGIWITTSSGTDTIGSDLNGCVYYNNGVAGIINSSTGLPNIGSTLNGTGWRQIIINFNTAFTDDMAFFIRFADDNQGMPIRVAQISIYNQSLSASQVKSLFNSKCNRFGLLPI